MDYDKLARELYDTLGTPLDDCASDEIDNDLSKIAQVLERADVSGRIEELETFLLANETFPERRLRALRKRLEELNARS